MPGFRAAAAPFTLLMLPALTMAADHPSPKAPDALGAQGTGPSDPGPPEYLVGVHYFAGWWEESPSKWETAGDDWRDDYPDRLPLLGQYNDQATMDKEIAAAAEHGVDFFQILWYYPGPDAGRRTSPQVDKLNRGVDCFRRSKESGRLKFTIVHTNHPPFQIPEDGEWEKACEYWCDVMGHPSYLRVGGRPVFNIHSLHHALEVCGWDRERLADRLAALRRIAQQSGLPDPLIGGGASALGVPSADTLTSIDFVSTYMGMPQLEKREPAYPYSRLLSFAEAAWDRYGRRCARPYVPYLPAGWDPRPWQDPRPSFEMPDREEWTEALRRVKAALDRQPNLGIPSGDGRRQKALVIYCWNEFGEGGIVAPTRGEGYMKLEAIRRVFQR